MLTNIIEKESTNETLQIRWILLIVAPGYGKDFFMYDAENNQIMEMGSAENTFTEKLALDKLPDRMMATDTPDNFIALYLPEMEKRKPTLTESLLIFRLLKARR